MNRYGARNCLSVMGAEAVAASTAYVLVDLSDTANYPHANANAIHLQALRLVTEKASDGAFDIWVGVVVENDDTDGTVKWLHVWHLEVVGNPTDTTDRFLNVQDFTLGGARPDGLNLEVVEGALKNIITYGEQAANANWQNDEGLASPRGAAGGATGKPGVGDLVFWVEETADGGTIDFMLSADYFAT